MGSLNRQFVLSLLCSAALHGALIAVAVWSMFPLRTDVALSSPGIQTVATDVTDQPAPEVPWHTDDSMEESESRSASGTSVDSPPSSDTPGLAGFVRERLEWEQTEAASKTPEEQIAELKRLAGRLENVATQESVQDVSSTLSGWLGAGERATEPSNEREGSRTEFDTNSAQFSDVRKVESPEGVQYIAVLVDARGNSVEAELDETEGSRLYEVFQLMKQFPLLETVYRSSVMGLLDQLVAPQGSEVAAPQPTPDAPTSE